MSDNSFVLTREQDRAIEFLAQHHGHSGKQMYVAPIWSPSLDAIGVTARVTVGEGIVFAMDDLGRLRRSWCDYDSDWRSRAGILYEDAAAEGDWDDDGWPEDEWVEGDNGVWVRKTI